MDDHPHHPHPRKRYTREKGRSRICIGEKNAKDARAPVIVVKEEMMNDQGSRSPQISRSSSFKNKQTPNLLQVEAEVPRRNSMPSPVNITVISQEELENSPIRRVRSFKMTSKGIVNKGDTFRRESNASMVSIGSIKSEDTSDLARLRLQSNDDNAEMGSNTSLPGHYFVGLLGAPGVGKRTITRQFTTSEYIGHSEHDDDESTQTVSVFLEGEESTLKFIDIRDRKMLFQTEVDAYVVVLSVNDRKTFDYALDMIHSVRRDMKSDKAIIIVANKIDLVRQRVVADKECRNIAEEYNCKFTETSVALNHQIDELLVGILKQIRLKEDKDAKKRNKGNKNVSLKGPKALLQKIFGKGGKKGTSCDNLYIT